MKIILLVFIILGNTLYAQDWEYFSNKDFVPEINGIFQSEMTFHPKELRFTRDSLLVTNIINGYSVYKGQEWEHITPDKILPKISNPNELQGLDTRYINTISTHFDKLGNTWLFGDRFILRYDGENYHAYRTVYNTNDEPEIPMFFNAFSIETVNDEEVIEVIAGIYYKEEGLMKYRASVFELVDNVFREKFQVKYGFQNYNPYFYRLKNGNYSIITSSSFQLLDNQGNELKNISTDTLFKMGIVEIKNCKKDKNDSIYMINSALFKMTFYNDMFVLDSSFFKKQREFSYNFTERGEFLYEIYGGKEYLLHANSNRLFIRDMTSSEVKVEYVPHLPGTDYVSIAHRMGIDSSGNVWLSYLYDGFYIFQPEKSSVENINSGGLPDVWFWNLYPNPAVNQVSASFFLERNAYKNVKAELIDLNGKLVKDLTSEINYDELQQEAVLRFNTRTITGGTYFLCISAGKSKKLKQLIIQR